MPDCGSYCGEISYDLFCDNELSGSVAESSGSSISFTAPASAGCTHVSNCTCNVGYLGPDGGPCTACAAGKFKCEGGLTPCIFNTTTYTKSELQAEISQCGSGNQLSCCFVENVDTSAITDMSRLFELSSFNGDI
eukprot:2569590-Rhodomonas_salina.1